MKRVFLALIRFYQKNISPFKPACCRFYPTCSSYAFEAVRRYGAIKGGLLSLWRILRCNPLCKGGADPVPDLKAKGRRAAAKGGGQMTNNEE